MTPDIIERFKASA